MTSGPVLPEGQRLMSHLVDFDSLPPIDVWGEAVRARALHGERMSMALVELAPGAPVPEHRHEQEQMGFCIEGSVRFRIGDEIREFGPGGTWRIPSNEAHEVVAGPEGAIVVDVFAPIREDWDDLPHVEPQPGRWPARP